MRYAFFLITFLILLNGVNAQNVYAINADSVKLTSCDSAELIIENHTQNIPGFLFNTGNGRTVFKRGVIKINDTLYLIGSDTLKVPPIVSGAWVQGGNSFGTTGVFGTSDNNHLDFYTNNIQRGRLTNTGNLLIGTTNDAGYKFDLAGQARIQNDLTITSTAPANIGELYVTANSSSFGTPPDFTFSVGEGARIYFDDFSTIFSGSISTTSLSASGTVNTGDLNVSGNGNIRSPTDNADNYIYLACGATHEKAAIIENALGSYGRMDLNFAFNNITDQSAVQKSDTKVMFKANGNVLIGSTDDNGNTFQVSGTSYFSSNVGLGTFSPTAQFHTTGTVRFAGLTSDSSQTRVLVSDADGNLFYRDASSLAFNDPIRSSLAVNGTITAQRLRLSQTGWPDYVFDSSYRLLPMEQLETYIKENNHLPGIFSAAEVKRDGMDVGDNQAALLKKIEELTLYVIQQNKVLEAQKEAARSQNDEVKSLKEEMEKLEKLISNCVQK